MSEITEQEAREAAKAFEISSVAITEAFAMGCDMVELRRTQFMSERTLADFARQELSRRDAEQAEREKPITADWLESIGWQRQTTSSGNKFMSFGLFHWFKGVVSFCSCKIETIATRGQLLDLLRALRGGKA